MSLAQLRASSLYFTSTARHSRSPNNLKFLINGTSVQVNWDQPSQPNGEILGYLVQYEEASHLLGDPQQVKNVVSEDFFSVCNLKERTRYNFSVRAKTVEYGPAVVGNVTTGYN